MVSQNSETLEHFHHRETMTERFAQFRVRPESSSTDSISMIHNLNNRACVSVLDGDYSAGIHLFELALEKHKYIAERESALSSPSPSSSFFCRCHCQSIQSSLEEFDHNMEWSSSSHDSDYSSDMDGSDDESDDEIFTIPSPLPFSSLSTSSSSSSSNRIKRITTTSKLRTFSFCGQHHYHRQEECQEGYSSPPQARSNPRFYHQVYCLPLVLDEDEWNIASIQDKSFVLIFNTALCYHLWGMELLGNRQHLQHRRQHRCQHQHQRQHDRETQLMDGLCHQALSTARTLYRLGLGNVSYFIHGVDKLCYVAMFNNISHVCKTLEGFNSVEAYCFDKYLLKSIYWWKDTESRRTRVVVSGTTSAAYASNTTRYGDEDSDIIDTFLENVFYLIGVPKNSVPAPAA